MLALWILLLIGLLIQLVLFLPAYIFKTDRLTDISYALTFLLLALLAFLNGVFAISKLILFLMIAIWAVRIGAYLFIRIMKTGKDKRFDGLREDFGRFISFWILQGVTVWIILLPTLIFFNLETVKLCALSLIGGLIWLVGMVIETLADYQKFNFKKKKEYDRMWCDVGLWKYSRHPNYFGEILVWLGIFVFTLSSLARPWSWFGAISPIYLAFLLIFVTGIPKLERSYEKRYGNLESYCEYKFKTSILIPWFLKTNKKALE